MSEIYTVWVGGTEVNDYLLDKRKAFDLAQQYIDDGYDDVFVKRIETREELFEVSR